MGALAVPLPMGFVVDEDRKIRVCQLLLNLCCRFSFQIHTFVDGSSALSDCRYCIG